MVTFTAMLHREGDMYVAECPEVGTVSQGATVEEAVDNLREATELYVDDFPLEEDRKSLMTTFEVALSALTSTAPSGRCSVSKSNLTLVTISSRGTVSEPELGDTPELNGKVYYAFTTPGKNKASLTTI